MRSGSGWPGPCTSVRPAGTQSFVKVDCGALPFQLLESEIFGYEPGAFTGAHRRKPGKIEAAHGGTIFLDEIGAMPRPLQARLLQVLQDGRVSRTPVVGMAPGSTCGWWRRRPRISASSSCGDDSAGISTAGSRRPASTSRPPRRPLIPPMTPRAEPGVARRADDGPSPRAATGNPAHEGDGLRAIARRAALDAERAVLKTVLEQVRWNRLEASRRLKISYKTLRWKIRQYGLDGS